MEQENREWRRIDPTHIRVGELLEIGTDSYYPYDTPGEEALVVEILADHRLAAVARGPVREALERIIALRFKGVSPYPMAEMECLLDEVRDAAGEALSALTPPEGETAAGEKGKIQ